MPDDKQRAITTTRAARDRPPRGRPPTSLVGEVGAIIRGALERRRLTLRELAHHLRISRAALHQWLTSHATYSHTIHFEALAEALALDAEQRDALALALQVYVGAAPAAPPNTADAVRAFIAAELEARALSYRDLARALQVAPSTVSRFMRGATPASHALKAQALCDALSLDPIQRRVFLGLVAQSGMFALASPLAAPTQLLHRTLDLDAIHLRITALTLARDQGRPTDAFEEAQHIWRRLARLDIHQRDPRPAATRVQVGALLATLIEATKPWYARHAALAMYERIAAEILAHFPENIFAEERAYLHGRIAPLYRELGDLNESVFHFNYAINHCLPHIQNADTRITLYRNRAHVWATQGDEAAWRSDLEKARNAAQRLPTSQREGAQGIITYSEGEGLKRLAGRPINTPSLRHAYAQRAYETLRRSRAIVADDWVAHELLLSVSEAQCIGMLDPHAAMSLFERLRLRAEGVYPALLRKIDGAHATARHAAR